MLKRTPCTEYVPGACVICRGPHAYGWRVTHTYAKRRVSTDSILFSVWCVCVFEWPHRFWGHLVSLITRKNLHEWACQCFKWQSSGDSHQAHHGLALLMLGGVEAPLQVSNTGLRYIKYVQNECTPHACNFFDHDKKPCMYARALHFVYSRDWVEETLWCRGVLFTVYGKRIRPFHKLISLILFEFQKKSEIFKLSTLSMGIYGAKRQSRYFDPR